MEQFKEILSKKFIKEGIWNNFTDAKVYFVGGCVRDHFLNLVPKDIDLVVQNVPYDNLVTVLAYYGTVDTVGESFGVIKFKEFKQRPSHEPFECEIALPRTDSLDKTKKGHTAIVAQSDPFLPIESDLKRRDFRINAIAIDQHLNTIDPFNGLRDIRKQIIAPTDPTTFVEDPLRLMRALQFAARFDFRLNYQCFYQIGQHKKLIKEITPERILMEFQKVVDKKGNVWHFLDLLRVTGLFEQIFDMQMGSYYNLSDTLNVKTLGELLYLTVTVRNARRGELPSVNKWGEFFEKKLKIDVRTKKELIVLEKIDKSAREPIVLNNKRCIFDGLKTAPWLFGSYFFSLPGVDMSKFESGVYPKSYSDLELNGSTLIELGFEEGKKIGEILDQVIDKIFANKLRNDKSELIDYVSNNISKKMVGNNNN